MPEYTDTKYHYLVALLLGISGLLIILIFVSIRSQAQTAPADMQQDREAPIINSIVISDLPQGDEIYTVSLNALSTSTLYIHGSYTDANGCDDIDRLGLVFYRSGVETTTDDGIAVCTNDDEQNCYDDSSKGYTLMTRCKESSSTEGAYQGTIDLQYFADATVGDFSDQPSDFSDQEWVAQITLIDNAGLSASAQSTTEVPLSNGFALESEDISFGSVGLNNFARTSLVTLVNTMNDNNQDYAIELNGESGLSCSDGGAVSFDRIGVTSSTDPQALDDLFLLDDDTVFLKENLPKASSSDMLSTRNFIFGIDPDNGAGTCTTSITVTTVFP